MDSPHIDMEMFVRHRDRRRDVVGDHDDRRFELGVRPLQQVPDYLRGVFVQVPRRFVGEDEDRVVGQRARHRDPLLLSAGEFGGVFPRLMDQFDVPEEFLDLRAADVFGVARDDEREHDVLFDRPLFDQFVVLEDDSDVAAQKVELGGADAVHFHPADDELSGAGLDGAVERFEERRFAASAGPGDEDEASRIDAERRLGDDGFKIFVGKGKVFGNDHFIHGATRLVRCGRQGSRAIGPAARGNNGYVRVRR